MLPTETLALGICSCRWLQEGMLGCRPARQCLRCYCKSAWHWCVGTMQRAFLLTYGFFAPWG